MVEYRYKCVQWKNVSSVHKLSWRKDDYTSKNTCRISCFSWFPNVLANKSAKFNVLSIWQTVLKYDATWKK